MTTTSHPGETKSHSGRIPWLRIFAALLIVVGMAIFLYPQTASWFNQKEQSKVTTSAMSQLQQPPHNDAAYRAHQFELAHQYNDALASGAVFKAGANIAVGDGISSNEELVYNELLSIGEKGFMGRMKYDSLGIDLPIYHGTSEETLRQGIGHLEGTSLPVGGDGARSVLTAHRGLPEATLFNELDRAEVGDRFTVAVLDQVSTYEVIETHVISPDDTEAIMAVPGQDLMTLITCTPLGINSHRILVTAERITPTPEKDIVAAAATPDIPGFPWWAVIFGVTVVGSLGYILLAARGKEKSESADA